MHFYFMISQLKQQLEGGSEKLTKENLEDLEVKSVAQSVAKSVAKSVAPSQMKAPDENKDQKDDDANGADQDPKPVQWSKEVIESEIDFLSLRIHHLICQFPSPKMTKDMEKKVKDSEENLFKFKLMEIKEKMMKMSTLQFDSISQGRVEK